MSFQSQIKADTDAKWNHYVASVMGEVVTSTTPEAIEWMADHEASLEDFKHDCCVYSEDLCVWFLNNDTGLLEDARLIAEAM